MNSPYPNLPTRRHVTAGRGFTYIEMMLALAIAALLIAGLAGVVGQALQSLDAVTESNRLTRDARFAMQRMQRTVATSRLLLLPQRDKGGSSNWPENIREQTIPPSAPIGSSSFATAVLALTLPANVDLDNDGLPDADNDADGLLDEDPGADIHNDNAAGIYLIDDGGNGTVDEGPAADDDERLSDVDDDPVNGLDDDLDNNFDEDPSADMNGDGCPGICGVDDDGNGSVDNGSVADDDEDGSQNEDWYDTVVYFLQADSLVERMPVPWDTNADSVVSGRDYVESVIDENVTRFRVERLDNGSAVEIVDLTLELTSPLTGETVSLQVQVRVGGSL